MLIRIFVFFSVPTPEQGNEGEMLQSAGISRGTDRLLRHTNDYESCGIVLKSGRSAERPYIEGCGIAFNC